MKKKNKIIYQMKKWMNCRHSLLRQTQSSEPPVPSKQTEKIRRIDYLVIHCTDTIDGVDWHIDDIRKWHTAPPPKGNGWSDIGYHYLIYLDGAVVHGRAESEVGAHVKNYNAHSIGISYVGGKEKGTMRSKDTRTYAQKKSMRQLLESLKERYPNAKIVGHCDLANRKCPCFDAKKEYRDL